MTDIFETLLAQGRAGGVEKVQSDWNINDPQNKSYIKNKPFYEREYLEETILDNILITFDHYGNYFIDDPNDTKVINIEENSLYKIIIDNIPYIVTGKKFKQGNSYKSTTTYQIFQYLGNLGMDGILSLEFPITNTQEPFFIGKIEASSKNETGIEYGPEWQGFIYRMPSAAGKEVTLTVKKLINNNKTLAPEFLSNFGQSDFMEGNPNSTSYIKNKPFYHEIYKDYNFYKDIRLEIYYEAISQHDFSNPDDFILVSGSVYNNQLLKEGKYKISTPYIVENAEFDLIDISEKLGVESQTVALGGGDLSIINSSLPALPEVNFIFAVHHAKIAPDTGELLIGFKIFNNQIKAFESIELFPTKGEKGFFYADKQNNKFYIWENNEYTLLFKEECALITLTGTKENNKELDPNIVDFSKITIKETKKFNNNRVFIKTTIIGHTPSWFNINNPYIYYKISNLNDSTGSYTILSNPYNPKEEKTVKCEQIPCDTNYAIVRSVPQEANSIEICPIDDQGSFMDIMWIINWKKQFSNLEMNFHTVGSYKNNTEYNIISGYGILFDENIEDNKLSRYIVSDYSNNYIKGIGTGLAGWQGTITGRSIHTFEENGKLSVHCVANAVIIDYDCQMDERSSEEDPSVSDPTKNKGKVSMVYTYEDPSVNLQEHLVGIGITPVTFHPYNEMKLIWS